MDPSTPRSRQQEPLSRVTGGGDEPVCQFCGRVIHFRRRLTKRFCGDLCRSRFHYARRQAEQGDLRRRLQEAEARLGQLEPAPGETHRQSVD